jgi:RND family efflux transporter MFP subunit
MHRTRGYAVAAVLACVLAGCGSGTKAQDVVVDTATARTVIDHPGGTGLTAAGLSVPVSVDFRDLVTAVDVTVGQVVTHGQPLLTMDPKPFANQVSALRTKEQLVTAEIANTQQRIAIAQSKGDQATASTLSAQIGTYRGEFVIYEQQIAIAQGHSTQILAPIDGEIGEVKIAPNAFASPGQILLTVVDTSKIDVSASLPITDRPFVTMGAPATISVTPPPGSTASGTVLSGTVTEIAAGASGNGTVFQATVEAANTATESVLLGLQAYARITVDRAAPVVVSKLAVLDPDTNPTVYVVDANNQVHPHSVQVGVSDGTYDQIVSGLNPGDLCVIVGNQLLTDGSRVRVTSVLG